MIQDIFPSKLNNEYKNQEVKDEDYVLVFDEKGRLYVGEDSGKMLLTTKNDVKTDKVIYLFSIDDENYFLCNEYVEINKEGFSYYTIRELRDKYSGKDIMAMFTAYHLWKWYADNVYCGKCASKLEIDNKERALRCSCGNVIYPRINPAVIVGVIKGDSILITRYNRGYAHNALVAGFAEIGETLEEMHTAAVEAHDRLQTEANEQAYNSAWIEGVVNVR